MKKTLLKALLTIGAILASASAKAQTGDTRNATCYDYGTPKSCLVRQTISTLNGYRGYHIIANWSDGDTTQIFLPIKGSGSSQTYVKFNSLEWAPSSLEYCSRDQNSYPVYIKAEGYNNGPTSGCLPDYMPNY